MNFFNKRPLLFVFLASLVFSLLFLVFLKDIGPSDHKIPGSDYLVYFEPMANNILQGKGITLNGTLPLNIGPAFPVILAGVFFFSDIFGIDRAFGIVFFNVIATAFTSCILFLLAKNIFNKKIALISAFLWASYPFNLWFLKNPNTEIAFIPLLYLGIFFYVLALKNKSYKFAFWSGVFLALSSSVRIISLFLGLFLAVLLFIFLFKSASFKFKTAIVAIFLLGSFVITVPWALYAEQKSGSFIPVSKLGKKSIVFGFTSILPRGDNKAFGLSDKAKESLEKIRAISNLEGEKKAFYALLGEMANHPLMFLNIFWIRISRVWYATYSMWWEKQILAVQSIYLLTAVLGLFYFFREYKGVFKSVFEKEQIVISILAVAVYFWIMAVLGGSILRYMVPAMGLLMMFSAIALENLWKKWFQL